MNQLNKVNSQRDNFGNYCSWGITILWCIYIYFIMTNGELPTKLNEIGDFFAGIFAPLAFFWLVRGFYQQSKGLEQNSEALRIQAEELTKSTETLELQVQEMKLALVQQTALAETTKQDLELSKQSFDYQLKTQHINAQPFFHISSISAILKNELFIDFSFSNSRATCRELRIYFKDALGENTNCFRSEYLDLILGNNQKVYPINSLLVPKIIRFTEQNRILIDIDFCYLDALDTEQMQTLHCVLERVDSNPVLNVLVQRPKNKA